MNLKNKIAIITGGTKGIGRGIAEAFVREGISVCISARHQDEIDEAVTALNQSGRAIGLVCDVRDRGGNWRIEDRVLASGGCQPPEPL